MFAAMQLLKGSVYEAQENWPLASSCYTSALRDEPLCYEALHRLVSNHMLSTGEQQQLLAELETKLKASNSEWLLVRRSRAIAPAVEILANMWPHLDTRFLQVYYRCKLDPEHGKQLAQVYETMYEAESTCTPPAAADAVGDIGGLGDIHESCDLLTAAAEYEYNHDQFRRCYKLSRRVLAKDPFQQQVLPVSSHRAICASPLHRRQ